MTIPFLKRKEASAAGDDDSPVERRKSDYENDDVLEVIASDFMDAIESKNKDLIVGALDALCEYLKDEIQSYE